MNASSTKSAPTAATGPASPIATLFPGYFALVMATGVIAIAARQQEINWLADALFAVTLVAYGVLVGLSAARAARYPRLLVADLTSHARGFAGTPLLGHCSTADANASCSASSARSKSPSSRTNVAKTRRDWSR